MEHTLFTSERLRTNHGDVYKRQKQLTNGYGAILTIRIGSKEKAFKFIDSLTIPYTLSNIGDTKRCV